MTASVKLGIAMLLALGLVAVITGDGWAGGPAFLVQIDDLTDTVTLTLSQEVPGGPLPPSPTILPGSVGEFLHFTLPLQVTPVNSLARSWDFFEGAPVLSDRLLITQRRAFLSSMCSLRPIPPPLLCRLLWSAVLLSSKVAPFRQWLSLPMDLIYTCSKSDPTLPPPNAGTCPRLRRCSFSVLGSLLSRAPHGDDAASSAVSTGRCHPRASSSPRRS